MSEHVWMKLFPKMERESLIVFTLCPDFVSSSSPTPFTSQVTLFSSDTSFQNLVPDEVVRLSSYEEHFSREMFVIEMKLWTMEL